MYKASYFEDEGVFVEQYKNGQLYAAYVVDRSKSELDFIVFEPEICINAPDGELLCFSIDHSDYMAFSVSL